MSVYGDRFDFPAMSRRTGSGQVYLGDRAVLRYRDSTVGRVPGRVTDLGATHVTVTYLPGGSWARVPYAAIERVA